VLRLRAGYGPGGVLALRALQAREDERVRRYGRKVKSVLRRGAQPDEFSAA
jgi:hypothetical protein